MQTMTSTAPQRFASSAAGLNPDRGGQPIAWPRSQLIELICASPLQAAQATALTLAALSVRSRWIVPVAMTTAHVEAAAAIDDALAANDARLHPVSVTAALPGRPMHRAVEQALSAPTVDAVVIWLGDDPASETERRALRRYGGLAERRDGWTFAVRVGAALPGTAAASTRVFVEATDGDLRARFVRLNRRPLHAAQDTRASAQIDVPHRVFVAPPTTAVSRAAAAARRWLHARRLAN